MPSLASARLAHLNAAASGTASLKRKVRVLLVTKDLNAADVLASVAGLEGLELVQYWPLNGLVELVAALERVPSLREIHGVAFCYLIDV